MVIGQFRDPTVPNSYGPGSILTLDTATGRVSTIAPRFTKVGTVDMGPNWIEMASDNATLMVASLPGGATSTVVGNGVYLHRVAADGKIMATLVADTTAGIGYVNAFDLDGDGTWILGGGTSVWAFDENVSTYRTFYNAASPAGTINALALDPSLPRGDIVLGKFNTSTSTTANLVEADRSGVLATICTAGPTYVTGIEVDRITGDYLCSAFGPGANGTGGELSRVSKSGLYQALNDGRTPMYRANAVHVDRQHMLWILTHDVRSIAMPPANPDLLVCSLYKVDPQGVFVTLYNFSSTLTRSVFAPSGLTEFGSRNVVCNGSGKPGTIVNISFSSRRATDASKPYQLAAAFDCRNGIRFPNGEYLDLSFDVLFFLTVNNLLPGTFSSFAGFLDARGEAVATVAIPASLPPHLGVPIYVSGVVIDPLAPGGASTVGNTHWFTLN
jgi:hypothetical protein